MSFQPHGLTTMQGPPNGFDAGEMWYDSHDIYL
jgi:hypothetical protein